MERFAQCVGKKKHQTRSYGRALHLLALTPCQPTDLFGLSFLPASFPRSE